MDPFTIFMTVLVLGAVTRDKPLPFLSELFNPHQKRGLDAGGGARMTSQPVVPQGVVSSVTYLQNGARWFKERACFALFEELYQYTLEPFAAEGRATPPGVYRLVPISTKPGSMTAADCVLGAARRGMYALLNVASALPEYTGVDKIMMFSVEPQSAHVGSQLAVLGPIKLDRAATASGPYRAAGRSDVAPPPASPPVVQAQPLTFDEELALAEKEGLPGNLVRAALAKLDAPSQALDEIALLVASFPVVATALRDRANILRAREKLEETLTDPGPTAPPSILVKIREAGHTNGAPTETPTIITTTGTTANAE